MTRRTRYFLFGSIVVLLVGLCTGLVAYYSGVPMNLVVDWYRKNLRTAYQDSPMSVRPSLRRPWYCTG